MSPTQNGGVTHVLNIEDLKDASFQWPPSMVDRFLCHGSVVFCIHDFEWWATPFDVLKDFPSAFILLSNTNNTMDPKDKKELFSKFDGVILYEGVTIAQVWDFIKQHSNFAVRPEIYTVVSAAVERIRQVKNDGKILVSSVEEELCITVAKLREDLGLGGARIDQAAQFIDKGRMCELFEKVGIPHMRTVKIAAKSTVDVKHLSTKLGYPMAVKPNACAGAFRFEKVLSEAQLIEWVAERRCDQIDYLAQEFIEGPQIAMCEALVLGGKFRTISAHRNYGANMYELIHPPYKPAAELMLPNDHPDHTLLFQLADEYFSRLLPHMHDSVYFLEIIHDVPNDRHLVIEVAARVEMGSFAYDFNEATGVDLLAWHLAAEVVTDITKEMRAEKRWLNAKPVGTVYYTNKPGTVKAFRRLPEECKKLVKRVEFEEYVKIGDYTQGAVSIDQNPGVISFEANDAASGVRLVEILLKFEPVEYE